VRSIPAALQAHLSGGLTTLATCWQLTRRDAVVLCFTDHDRDIVVPDTGDGVAGTYLTAVGYTGSRITSQADLSVDSLEVTAILDASAITEADLRAGLYDLAEVRLFAVNWADPSQGIIRLRRGWLGEVTTTGATAKAELRGMAQALQQTIGETYTPACRADLGDTRCGVTLASVTATGTVTAAASQSVFTDSARGEAAGWFDFGLLTWTSGANNGRAMEVKTFAGGVFTLVQAMPSAIAVGDSYSVYAGCDKRLATCGDKFSNVVNFRGEPYIPGIDELLRYPDAS
jgi:uncharacterized phage protein (TIGR02218 family)